MLIGLLRFICRILRIESFIGQRSPRNVSPSWNCLGLITGHHNPFIEMWRVSLSFNGWSQCPLVLIGTQGVGHGLQIIDPFLIRRRSKANGSIMGSPCCIAPPPLLLHQSIYCMWCLITTSGRQSKGDACPPVLSGLFRIIVSYDLWSDVPHVRACSLEKFKVAARRPRASDLSPSDLSSQPSRPSCDFLCNLLPVNFIMDNLSLGVLLWWPPAPFMYRPRRAKKK